MLTKLLAGALPPGMMESLAVEIPKAFRKVEEMYDAVMRIEKRLYEIELRISNLEEDYSADAFDKDEENAP